MDRDKNRFHRKDAAPMSDVVADYIREMKISAGLNKCRIDNAWYAVSGVERFTISTFYKNKVYTCTLNSSLVRNQLYFQRESLVQQMNEFLKNDELFINFDGKDPIETLVLR